MKTQITKFLVGQKVIYYGYAGEIKEAKLNALSRDIEYTVAYNLNGKKRISRGVEEREIKS